MVWWWYLCISWTQVGGSVFASVVMEIAWVCGLVLLSLFRNLQNGEKGSACFQMGGCRGQMRQGVMSWAGPWCREELSGRFPCGDCEVLACRFRACLILICIVQFLFAVRNITHDKFDNLDYLCWVTKIYDYCWQLFAFLSCHLEMSAWSLLLLFIYFCSARV